MCPGFEIIEKHALWISYYL